MRLVLVCFVVVTAAFVVVTVDASSDPAPSRQALVQGKSVGWWARRARANKRAVVWQRQRGDQLRAALKKRVVIAGDLTSGFLCIQTFEGSWDDPNAPYWGGMQMDIDFMVTYGLEFYRAWGTADNWPPFVQVAVAMRAHLSGRGFGPWPTTRRYCGV